MTRASIKAVRHRMSAKLDTEDPHIALECDGVTFTGRMIDKRRRRARMGLASDVFLISPRCDKAERGRIMPVTILPHAARIKHFVNTRILQRTRADQI